MSSAPTGYQPPMWVLVSAILCGAALAGGVLLAGGMVTPAMAAHGAMMLAAWGAMIPLGGIMARYHKVTRAQRFPAEVDNPFWWDWHRRLQYGGFALAVAGLATILSATGGRFDTAHGRCGLVVMAIGGLQIASPLFRGRKGGPTDARADPADPATWRGDHYDMTRRRRWFEAWHKTAGWTLIALAAVTILLGIDLLGAPPWLVLLAGMAGPHARYTDVFNESIALADRPG